MRKMAALSSLLLVFVLVLGACATSTPPTPAADPTTAPAAPAVAAPAAEPTTAPAPAAPATDPTAAPAPSATADFKQSPALDQLVQNGDLPPVAERLPANPQVVTPLVEAGAYGGTLRQGFVGGSATWGGMLYTVQWENLVQWKPDFSDIEPSIAERIEVSADGREYIFHFRDGMKWSDGAPFGADDVLFYINDVLMNEELFPSGPTVDWLPANQVEGFSAEKVGDNAVKLSFPNPYGTLLYQLATFSGRQFAQYPKHYLQQFHKDYNPQIDELVQQDSSLENWTALFFKMAPENWGNPDRFMDVVGYPSLGPWIVTQPLGSGTTATFTRNPYYWKVDDQGRQLPYIDEVIAISYQDSETRTLAMLNGDLDFIKDPGESNREVYYDAMTDGKPIRVVSTVSDGGNTISLHFNQTSKDEGLAEIFANKDFRIGMSYAINRPELIEVVFKGQGTPAQVSPVEGSPLYNERLANQYTEYDVAQANEHLDKVLPAKDANGMRLRPDGTPLQIILTCLDANYTGGDAKAWLQAAELMTTYFKAVGVDVKLDVVSDQVLTERRNANAIDAFIFHGSEGGAGMSALIDPRWHIPGEYWGVFGLGWHHYLFGAPEIKAEFGVPLSEQQVAHRQAFELATQQTSHDAQIEAMARVLEMSADAFWTIGVSRPGNGFQPISARLANYPEGRIAGWLSGNHKLVRPEQWFIKQ